MALSLSCSCGAQFEIEETLAGQTILCPECQQPLPAPRTTATTVRTSGLALTSAVCALVLAFTGIGTILAVFLGLLALVSIGRNRGRLAGTGFAVFGIVWGVLFTGLFAFAVIRGEIFGIGDLVRERFLSGQVDYSGPLEVRPPGKGFSITRPTPRWGIAKDKLAKEAGPESDLVLVQVAQDAYVDVTVEQNWMTLDGMRAEMLRRFRQTRMDVGDDPFERALRPTAVSVRHDQRLQDVDGVERAELLLDVKVAGNWFTFLVRLVRPARGGQVYIIRSWAHRNRFRKMESELRSVLDSFRVLEN
jgi:hypothetical protein